MLEVLLFVLVIVLLFWVSSISGRVTMLEQKTKGGIVPADRPIPTSSLQAAPPPQITTSPSSSLKLKSEHDETEIAAGWLNKIGIVAIVIGMGFFFKYAIDQGWIGPWMRVIIGFAVGLLFVFLGELWKEKYEGWAQAASGGGIAILYFTIYAAFGFLSLIPQMSAFVLFLSVGGLATWLSVRNKSVALGALAFFGAYGAPFTFRIGADQQGFLFAYLSILNIAVLGILVKYYWVELLTLALAGTALNFLLWGTNYTAVGNTFASLYFVIFTTAAYVLGSALLLRYHHRAVNPASDRNLAIFSVLTGLFYLISLCGLLYDDFRGLLAPVALMGGVLFLFGYAFVDRLEYRLANYSNSLVAAVLLTGALIWQYDGLALALGMLLLGAFGMTVGAFLNREELRVWSICLFLLSVLRGLAQEYTGAETAFLLNAKFGLMLLQTVVFLYTGWLYAKVPATATEKGASGFAYLAAAGILWFAVSWELVEFYSGNAQNLYLSLWWIVYAVLLMVLSSALKSPLYRKAALALFALSIVKVFIYDSSTLDTPYRVIAFIVLGIILLSVSFAYQKNKEKIIQFIDGEEARNP